MSEKTAVERELQQQLLVCLKSPWHSLAVVPASPRVSASAVASALVDVSNLVRGQHTKLFSTEDLEMAGVSKVIVDVASHVADGGFAVLAVESVITTQAGIPATMAADAAVLVVQLGVTGLDDARRTVELLGHKKFIGAITLEPRAGR